MCIIEKMNYNEEPYPENVLELLNHANKLSNSILEELNNSSCTKVGDLYNSINNKIIRKKELFNQLGYFANEISSANKNTQPDEFKGLYIFGEEINDEVIPVYVGISRTVFRRLRQHAWGKKHNECSLAYLKTREHWREQGNSIGRSTITNEDMLTAKIKIQNYKVVLVPVLNDYDLYFLEVALAGKFKTKWNSFRTH